MLKTIAELKAASGVLRAVAPLSDGDDNIKQPASHSAASVTGLENAAGPVNPESQACYALTPDELAEFIDLIEQSGAPLKKAAYLIKQGSHSALTFKDYVAITTWMAKKRNEGSGASKVSIQAGRGAVFDARAALSMINQTRI